MFTGGFDKVAKIDLNDLEEELGVVIQGAKDRVRAQAEMDRMNRTHLGLAHPILTGIPTLGLWPAISQANALRELAGKMRRESPAIAKGIAQLDRENHQREVALMARHIAEREADARENMMALGSMTALSGLDTYLRHRGR